MSNICLKYSSGSCTCVWVRVLAKEMKEKERLQISHALKYPALCLSLLKAFFIYTFSSTSLCTNCTRVQALFLKSQTDSSAFSTICEYKN